MTKLYKPLLAPLGLTYPQYLVMLVLWEGDGVAVSQVGERLSLDSGTLTPLLKRLEAAGLLQRVRDVADERRVLLQLTTAGRRLKARAASVPHSVACATGCNIDELASLTARLRMHCANRSISPPPRPERRFFQPQKGTIPWPSKKPSTPPTPNPPAAAPAPPSRPTVRSSFRLSPPRNSAAPAVRAPTLSSCLRQATRPASLVR